jgi:uncharacterized membrane protein
VERDDPRPDHDDRIHRPDRRSLGGSALAGGANKARHILDERFARGEIDKDDYEERKRVLSD